MKNLGEMDSNQGKVSKVQKLSDDQAQEADAIKQQRSKELAVTLHKQKEEIKVYHLPLLRCFCD